MNLHITGHHVVSLPMRAPTWCPSLIGSIVTLITIDVNAAASAEN